MLYKIVLKYEISKARFFAEINFYVSSAFTLTAWRPMRVNSDYVVNLVGCFAQRNASAPCILGQRRPVKFWK